MILAVFLVSKLWASSSSWSYQDRLRTARRAEKGARQVLELVRAPGN